jgi:hypothetical protein
MAPSLIKKIMQNKKKVLFRIFKNSLGDRGIVFQIICIKTPFKFHTYFIGNIILTQATNFKKKVCTVNGDKFLMVTLIKSNQINLNIQDCIYPYFCVSSACSFYFCKEESHNSR